MTVINPNKSVTPQSAQNLAIDYHGYIEAIGRDVANLRARGPTNGAIEQAIIVCAENLLNSQLACGVELIHPETLKRSIACARRNFEKWQRERNLLLIQELGAD